MLLNQLLRIFTHKKYNWQRLNNSREGFLFKVFFLVILETKWNTLVNKYSCCKLFHRMVNSLDCNDWVFTT